MVFGQERAEEAGKRSGDHAVFVTPGQWPTLSAANCPYLFNFNSGVGPFPTIRPAPTLLTTAPIALA